MIVQSYAQIYSYYFEKLVFLKNVINHTNASLSIGRAFWFLLAGFDEFFVCYAAHNWVYVN